MVLLVIKLSTICIFSLIFFIKLIKPEIEISKNHKHRYQRAFDLVRIEKLLDDPTLVETQAQNLQSSTDGVHPVLSCRSKCNEQLRMGLDMVKAHVGFGSIGVPSVEDRDDLTMFCRLDAENDVCLQRCGYEIQFNMRNYICKEHFEELVANLECYSRASAHMKRSCGEKHCGPYKEFELSLQGLRQRCRALTCDLDCTRTVLQERCASEPSAINFLFDYSRMQVLGWLRELNASGIEIPRPCLAFTTTTTNSTNSSFNNMAARTRKQNNSGTSNVALQMRRRLKFII